MCMRSIYSDGQDKPCLDMSFSFESLKKERVEAPGSPAQASELIFLTNPVQSEC